MVFFKSIDGKKFKKTNFDKKNFLIKKKVLKNNFEKNIWKKNFRIFFGKYWKKFARKKCGHFNEVGRKILLILFVLLVVPKIKLWTRWN